MTDDGSAAERPEDAVDRLGRLLGHECPECDRYAMTGTTNTADPDVDADEQLRCPNGHTWTITYDDIYNR